MAWQIGQYYKEKGQELLEGGQGEVDEFRETYLDEDTAWNQNLGQKAWYPVQKLGEAQDFVNEQVNLRNTLQISKEFTDRIPGQWDERILDYYYKDLRDHTAGGIGNVARFVTGSERAGQIGELAGQILIPDAVDFIGGVGYIDNLARGANVLRKSKFVSKGWKNGDELLKAFKKGGDHAHVAFNNAREAIAEKGRTVRAIGETLTHPVRSVQELAHGLGGTGLSSATDTAGIIKKTANVDSISRAEDMLKQGFEFEPKIQKMLNQLKSGDMESTIPRGYKKIFTDEAAYRKAFAEGSGKTSGTVQEIGVYKTPDGDIRYMKQRGGKDKFGNPVPSLRGTKEQYNTDLNRAISEMLQTGPGKGKYDSSANVKYLMEQTGFKGSAAKFKEAHAIHHRGSIKAYQPFFEGLDVEQAGELRDALAKQKPPIFLGANRENLVAIPKDLHTLKREAIHNWMRRNGIEGKKGDWEGIKGSYDPQADMLRHAEGKSVAERVELIKGYRKSVQEPTDEYLDAILKQWVEEGVIKPLTNTSLPK